MKKISTLMLTFLLVVSVNTLDAQWSLTGNSNVTGTSILGTTNAFPVNLTTNNLNRMTITSAGQIGVGITNPSNIFSIKGSGGNPAASWINSGAPLFTGYGEETIGNADFLLSLASTISSARPVFIGRRSKATLAAPGAVVNNDYLMSILASGYDGTAFQNPAAIDFYVDGTPSAGNVPARISFVTGNNFNSREERLKILSGGDVSIVSGNLNMLASNKTMQFSNSAFGSPGMITMFPSGTSNKTRMVLALSPTLNNWGLQYADSIDQFDFMASGTSILGIGLATPALNLNAGNLKINAGNLNLTAGNINMNSAANTIQFATPTVGSAAMMTMFPNGTQNPTRMVIAHSSANPKLGLQYNDTTDQFDFLANGVSGLNINPSSGTASAKTAFYAPKFYSTDSSSSPAISSNNNGTGHGIYGYTAGHFILAPNGISGVYGYNASFGYGVGGYGTEGVGVYGYSYNYSGIWGSNRDTTQYAGFFQGDVFSTGNYTTSDRKLKKDIAEMTGGMEIISQLKPKTYEFRQDGNYKLMNLPAGKQYGLIAQDMEEVLPGLVKKTEFDPNMVKNVGKPEVAAKLSGETNKQANDKADKAGNLPVRAKVEEKINFKAVNYTELIPIIIKGMQEQQALIEVQNAKIAALTELVEKLSPVTKLAVNNVKLSTATLEQNVPNPPVNNMTRIGYNIPKGVVKAELIISDNFGKKVKQVTLNNSGKGLLNVDTSGLAAGTYSYTMVVDGKVGETKKMLVAGH